MATQNPVHPHENIAIIGLGEAGRAAATLLAAHPLRIVALDRRPDPQRGDLPEHVEIRGQSQHPDAATLAVLSPGANPEWPENRNNPDLLPLWTRWREAKIELRSEVEVAAAAHTAPLLSIGGTDGKSTTAALTAHLLRALDAAPALGGNSWRALSAVVAEQPDARVLVAEISAFQLWEPHTLHPRVAVMTNIEPDHLDHYGTVEAYVAAKRHILRNMGPGDWFVFYAADARLLAFAELAEHRGVNLAAFAGPDSAQRFGAHATVEADSFVVRLPGNTLRIPTAALSIPGAHNQRNAMAAILAAMLVPDAPPADESSAARLAEALATFHGLPHRVALVRELDGVRWYNDSKATNVHAAVTGLAAFEQKIVAIVGGVDKGLSLTPLIELLATRARATIAIGSIAPRFVAEAGEILEPLVTADSMEEAVRIARTLAQPGDVVVLSPACSSFDMFRSFEHRGDVFEAAVRALLD